MPTKEQIKTRGRQVRGVVKERLMTMFRYALYGEKVFKGKHIPPWILKLAAQLEKRIDDEAYAEAKAFFEAQAAAKKGEPKPPAPEPTEDEPKLSEPTSTIPTFKPTEPDVDFSEKAETEEETGIIERAKRVVRKVAGLDKKTAKKSKKGKKTKKAAKK